MKIVLTLCIICRQSQILLGMKKVRWGAGRWNGFGGGVKGRELIEMAARREVLEECGLEINQMQKVGLIGFEFANDPMSFLEVHIFLSDDFTGEPQETDEMRPKWFDIKDIPYDEMWTVDKFWLPQILEGKKIRGRVLYSDDKTQKIISKDLREVNEI
ncbi:MAG: 8-oxo-dGTP diphosphatase [Patescibacteria group bacterium]